MILSPAIIALEAGAVLAAGYAAYASAMAMQIIQGWDIASGSEQQLLLEKKTYLISTIFAWLMAYQIISLFLFSYTAEKLHDLFVGAMCAAGSLNVNDYGYPTLVLKAFNCLLCGIWLIVNRTDNSVADYPLIKPKYKLLIGIAVLLLIEAIFQTTYFVQMKADVITSCCGMLFSETEETVAGGLAALPSYPTKVIFYLSVLITLRVGIHHYRTGRAALVYSLSAAWLLILSIAAVISFIAPHFYELPGHHCPFCILQREYHYIGYPLYLALFTGGIAGLGVGVIDRFKGSPSLHAAGPLLQKHLCLLSMIGYMLFAVISVYPMIFSDFRLEGY